MENKDILEMKNITKVYSTGLLANSHVDFSLRKGEIHALAGENGAGKTTLMKILFGLEKPDEGEILLNGRRASIENPIDAIHKGIGMVHQHFMLIPSLTVAENMVLGEEPGKYGLMDNRKANRLAEEMSKKYNMPVRPGDKVEDLPVGIRQKVEILKALYKGADILILDEPTAVLTPQETKELFAELKGLRAAGHTIVFISHKLNEVKELCDRITILRDGRNLGVYQMRDVSEQEISSLMVGRKMEAGPEKKAVKAGRIVLDVKGLRLTEDSGKQVLCNINFQIKAGEIVGIAAVEGNGQKELSETVAGLGKFWEGDVTVEGASIKHRTLKEIRGMRVAHVPEDRVAVGLVGEASVCDNLITYIYDKKEYSRHGLLDRKKISDYAGALREKFLIKSRDGTEAVRMLSGGNMQKVVVARECSTSPSLIILNQPTRGIDVGAAEFVRRKVLELRDQGTAVFLVSADLNELFSLSDRLLVMFNGRIVAEINNVSETTENELGEYMLGLKVQEGM